MTSGEDFPTVHAGFSSHGTGAGEELQSAARTSLQKLLHGGWRRTSELLHPVSAEKRPSDATGQDNNEHPDGNDNYSCVGQSLRTNYSNGDSGTDHHYDNHHDNSNYCSVGHATIRRQYSCKLCKLTTATATATLTITTMTTTTTTIIITATRQ
ncbi:uncharacterized protein LOC135391862 isoform X1 [Ornithodoros turicata]|uniref:uncharacterized protein LOC135391862 isoform X1 n=2 Tax=Ornithodoros turicata TaxID=34597 RepID=UPI00313A028F